jgi:hypothetical protein
LIVFKSSNNKACNQGISRAIPLPPNCRDLLSIQTNNGEWTSGFSGTVGIDEVKTFYQEWFQHEKQAPIINWIQKGSAWHARYKELQTLETIDIHCAIHPRGGICGVIHSQTVKP